MSSRTGVTLRFRLRAAWAVLTGTAVLTERWWNMTIQREVITVSFAARKRVDAGMSSTTYSEDARTDMRGES